MGKFLKALLAISCLTCATLAACVPTAIVDFRAPFAAWGLLVLLAFSTRSVRQDHDRRMLAIATAVLSLPLLLPGTMLVFMLEGQADDGPFYGRKASVGVKALAESESVPYKSGRIVVCNRVAERTPVMFFEDRRGEVRWAVEMDVLTKVEGLHISRGILRDVVHFTGWWTAGQEQGRAFIWKFNRFQRFYLSW